MRTNTLTVWLPALCVMAVIFALSSLSGSAVDSAGLNNEGYQINGHFILYFVLLFALFRATRKLSYAVGLAFVYSLTDELHQLLVPGRHFQFFDIFVDAVGYSLAALILWKYYSQLPAKLKNWLKS